MSFPTADRAAPDGDDNRFEAHLVSNLLATLSDVAAFGAGDYHIRKERRDRFVEVKLKPGRKTKGVHYVLLQVEDGHPAKGRYGPRRVTDGLRLVIADVVKATVEEVGALSAPADPALERLTQVIARILPKARRMASEATIEKMVDALVETQDPIAQASAAIDADNARASSISRPVSRSCCSWSAPPRRFWTVGSANCRRTSVRTSISICLRARRLSII